MIIGVFDTTASQFFNSTDIEFFMRDLNTLGYDLLCKRKRGSGPGTKFPTVIEVIRRSDIVIGCPFTSPVIEALSSGVPAFWYDPHGICDKSIYVSTPFYRSKLMGLLDGIKFWRGKQPDEVKSISRQYGRIIDPYSDGGGIDRFRDLLIPRIPESPIHLKCYTGVTV